MGETMTSKYATELDIVQRFLEACGIARPLLSDPNQRMTTDSGADVVWTRDQSVIGFQVTEYHSDEGRDPSQKGSQLRRDEKRRAAASGVYTKAVLLDPIPAIVRRVAQKSERAGHADVQRFSELILLIVSSRPQSGGTAAGFLLDPALDLPRLNWETHQLLSNSAYTSAYIFNMLSLDGTPSIYRWAREAGWTRITPSESATAVHAGHIGEDIGLRTLRYLSSLGGPRPAPGSLSDGLDATFIPELLKAFPGRDPSLEEIKAFERSWRDGHRR